MKAIIFNTQPFERSYLNKSNEDKHEIKLIEVPLSTETAHMAKGFDVVSITGEQLNEKLLTELWKTGVKYISLRIAGIDRIDLKSARKIGFIVANVPDYSPFAVAEHAMMLMLALNRKLLRANAKVREYDFTLEDLVGFDMHQKTVGLVGLGKTGSVLAKILHGFGCKILGYNRSIKPKLTQKYGVEFCSLEDLAKKSDIISVHLPLNDQTHYLIDKKLINKMKPGVMIINTSRGAILKISDVIEAIINEQVGSLGLDVYENETGLFFHDHSKEILKDEIFARLLSFKNVIITGHMAFLTHEALTNIAATTIATLDCWQMGNKAHNELF